jgi:hypothetical protein
LLDPGCAHTERRSTTTDRWVARPITGSQTRPRVARFPWRTYDARHGRRLSRCDYMGKVAGAASMSEPSEPARSQRWTYGCSGGWASRAPDPWALPTHVVAQVRGQVGAAGLDQFDSVPAVPSRRAKCHLPPRLSPHWQCGGQGFESPQLHQCFWELCGPEAYATASGLPTPTVFYEQVKSRRLPASELLQAAVRVQMRRQDLLPRPTPDSTGTAGCGNAIMWRLTAIRIDASAAMPAVGAHRCSSARWASGFSGQSAAKNVAISRASSSGSSTAAK